MFGGVCEQPVLRGRKATRMLDSFSALKPAVKKRTVTRAHVRLLKNRWGKSGGSGLRVEERRSRTSQIRCVPKLLLGNERGKEPFRRLPPRQMEFLPRQSGPHP